MSFIFCCAFQAIHTRAREKRFLREFKTMRKIAPDRNENQTQTDKNLDHDLVRFYVIPFVFVRNKFWIRYQRTSAKT